MKIWSALNDSCYFGDTKRKSAVKSYNDRWVAEMAIPFRSLWYQNDIVKINEPRPCQEFNLTDRETGLSYTIGWQNKSQLYVSVEEEFVQLGRDFDPANNGEKLDTDEQFHWKSARAGFTSDARKLLNYKLNAGIGGYYSGNRWYVNGLMNYRVQPYGSFGRR